MSTSRTTLRRSMSDLMGDFVRDPDGSVPTCSAQGGAAGITAIDILLSYYPDDFYNDWYFVLPQGPTGSGSYEVTRVVDFTGATGTLTLEPDASGQIASGQTYELHRYNPATKHLALNAARLQAIDALWLPVRDETLVVDNLISNWDFETYAGGAFTNWVSIGSPTLTQNTSYFMHGSNAANIAGAAGVGIEQNIITSANSFGRIANARRKVLHVRGFLRATDASNIRLRLTFDGSTYTNGAYHSGDDDWESPDYHYFDVSIPAGATEMTISVEKSTAVAAQADVVIAWIDPINRYTLPTTIHRRPSWIYQQVNRDRPNGDYAPLSKDNRALAGHILKLTGKGLLTEVTTETGTMEVSDPETQLLYAEALDWLIVHEMGGASEASQVRLERDKERWQVTAARLRVRGEIARVHNVQYPDGTWHMETDGETENILLRNR